MQIRTATVADIDAISGIYEAIHQEEALGLTHTGWLRGIYPTRHTAEASVARGDMVVLEEEGRVCAAARINADQDSAYGVVSLPSPADPDRVLVIHTLVVDPACRGKGYAKALIAFYEAEALRLGRPFLRMDTNARNVRARAMYGSLGYREADIIPCEFNGIPGVELVCLEKAL